jgi:hypothetical protein
MIDNNGQEPWRTAQSGAEYCMWEDLPDEFRSQLKMENGCTEKIGDYSYHVKQYENGSWIVFKNPSRNYKNGPTTTRRTDRVYTEFQVLPIEEANKLLPSGEFEPVGPDPVKVIDHEFFVVLGKKEKVR